MGGPGNNTARVILIAVSIWAAYILLLVTRDMAGDLVQGRVSGPGMLVRPLIAATVWALLFPLIIYAARRFSVLDVASPWRLLGVLSVHFSIGFALTYVHDLATTLVLFLEGGGSLSAFAPFSNRWLSHLARNPFPATYAVVVGLTWLFVSGWKLERERTVRARLEGERHRLELKVLEQGLQPHLLFNALQVIGFRNETLSGDLQRLADYLRMILDGRDRDLVRVDLELDHLKVFLDLARLRFEDRELVEVVLASGCEAMLVPAFSLQTLVENALRHGDSDEMVQVSISSGSVRVCNRIGSPQVARPGWGIGLSTLRSRLDLLFGGEATLEMKVDGTHCIVEMILPVVESA